mmetsp:Transcript_6337/g.16613  ORF Transcript_6337/g.16613 Transcript_6337/m.16613 type:complete len:442 (+) Transcript_6337:166-1491(+)|eukprot:jgi/Tetstr1/437491/TSEL_026170.t1
MLGRSASSFSSEEPRRVSALPLGRSYSLPADTRVLHVDSPTSTVLVSLKSAFRWLGGVETARFRAAASQGGPPFNLNLSYVTPRIIALRAPALGGGGFGSTLGRDSEAEVVRFLEATHPGRYRRYDLEALTANGEALAGLQGASHPVSKEGKRRAPAQGSAPSEGAPLSLEAIGAFAEDAMAWLRGPSNVAVVQCGDGAHLTGLAICCLLLRQGIFASPDAALAHFGRMRLRHPAPPSAQLSASQRRYLRYFFNAVRQQPPARLQRPPRLGCLGQDCRRLGLAGVSIAGLPRGLASDAAVALWLRPVGAAAPLRRVWLLASAGCKAAQPFYGAGALDAPLPGPPGAPELALLLCKPMMLGAGSGVALAARHAPLPLPRGDICVAAFAGAFAKQRQFFSAWLHTDHVQPGQPLVLPAGKLDPPRGGGSVSTAAELQLIFCEL